MHTPNYVCCLALTLLITSFSYAEQWNQFRGPNGQGIMESQSLPSDFTNTGTLRWKIPLLPGNSSPVLWNDRIFLTSYDPDEKKTLYVHCINAATGEELWRNTIKAKAHVRYHPMSNPAAPTPAVDAQRLYVYFGTYGLLCYDHDGTLLWEEVIKPPKNTYGMATSPILYKDTVIQVLDDNNRDSRVVAFHQETGEERWSTERTQVKSGWSTPTIWQHEDHDELIIHGASRLAAYKPNDGELLWWVNGMPQEPVGIPILGNGLLYASAAALGGRGEPKWDGDTMWDIVIRDFDADQDGAITRKEMDAGFVIPFRPDLPKDNPGYAYPNQNPDDLLDWFDADEDKIITKPEWDEVMKTFIDRDQPILIALTPGAIRNARRNHIAWDTREGIPEIPSLLNYQNRLYLIQNGGKITCLKSTTGDVLYKERLNAPGQYCASPIAGDGKIYIVSVRGTLITLQADDALNELARHELKEKVHATPALHNGTLYLRSLKHLYAFRK